MRETYWERFVTTGSVKDYLSYRAEKENPGTGAEKGNSGTRSERKNSGSVGEKEDAGCQTEPGKHFRKGET
ncbi:MAG TPA: hypothetical protein H9743_08325 [Candidatus Mediterraneibacter vanvlietii]|nr:hypothetical protein [Candidatus Mediterraneibacter vanvlietii]